MTAETSPLISVLIPTYERGEQAARTLALVLGEPYPNFEVLVVDQSAEFSPLLRSVIELAGGKVKLLRPGAVGLPLARNLATREARAEILVFLDDDAEPSPGFLCAFARHFEDSTLGAVAGRVIELDATPPAVQHGTVGDAGWFGNKNLGLASTQPGPALTFQGCNVAIRRSAVVQAGGFDEGFVGPAFREDADMAARLLAGGWKILFEPAACVRHLKLPSGGTRAPSMERQRLILENEVRFALRHLRGLRLACWLVGRWRALVLPRWNLTKPLLVGCLSMHYWRSVYHSWFFRHTLRKPLSAFSSASGASPKSSGTSFHQGRGHV